MSGKGSSAQSYTMENSIWFRFVLKSHYIYLKCVALCSDSIQNEFVALASHTQTGAYKCRVSKWEIVEISLNQNKKSRPTKNEQQQQQQPIALDKFDKICARYTFTSVHFENGINQRI